MRMKNQETIELMRRLELLAHGTRCFLEADCPTFVPTDQELEILKLATGKKEFILGGVFRITVLEKS